MLVGGGVLLLIVLSARQLLGQVPAVPKWVWGCREQKEQQVCPHQSRGSAHTSMGVIIQTQVRSKMSQTLGPESYKSNQWVCHNLEEDSECGKCHKQCGWSHGNVRKAWTSMPTRASTLKASIQMTKSTPTTKSTLTMASTPTTATRTQTMASLP